jgi:histidinol-phosphate aminotransferase
MDELTRLARPEILALRPYVTGRDGADEHPGVAWLDANESPYPPFHHAPDRPASHRYPEPQPRAIVERLAEHFGAPASHALLSRGAEEAISLLVRAFCTARVDGVLVNTPTFAMYEVATRIQDAALHEVPLRGDDFRLDHDRIASVLREHPRTKLVFVCTPNNPTGNLVAPAEILDLCARTRGTSLVVADETYLEYADAPSLIPAIHDHPNLVVLRTLSKAYGLAGERCGVTLAHPAVISVLRRILPPYPMTRSSLDVVARSITPEGIAYARANIATVCAERDRVQAELARSPIVERVFPSSTNFVLFRTPEPAPLVEAFRAAGIRVRDRSDIDGIRGCVRVTIGLPAHNDRVLDVLTRHAARTPATAV